MTNTAPPNSRYFGLATRTAPAGDGESVEFIGRRIIPAVERYKVLDRHRTVASERIDQVGDAFYGDPEQYWRICDANGVERPAEASEPAGRLLVIPVPLEMGGHGDT